MSDLGGAGGGAESEWNKSSVGSVASSSTGGAPTPQPQGRRASGGPRRGGGASAKKVPGNGKGKLWTVDEQVALCEAFKLVAQRSDMGADWSRECLWDTIQEDFVKHIPKSLKPSDLKGRWSERTAGSKQTQIYRKIAPDVQRFAHVFNVVSDKKQLTGGLTEEDLVRAAAGLFSGVSAYQAVRQDACSYDERERQGKARAERTGHVVTCACIPMWRVLREMDKFSAAAADADAVADHFHGTGGQQGLWNQAFFVALGYIPHCLRCTLESVVFDKVIDPKSDLAGPDGVRINSIIGYSISAISDMVRIDKLNIFSWMLHLDKKKIYR